MKQRQARRCARADTRRRSGSRTSCRTTASRNPATRRLRSRRLVGTYAAASRSTCQPRSARRQRDRADASHRRSSTAPETRTGSGALGPPLQHAVELVSINRAGPGTVSGAYSTAAPFADANSRMPLTELWLSAVRSSCPPGANGNDSPTSLIAAEAFSVKTAV